MWNYFLLSSLINIHCNWYWLLRPGARWFRESFTGNDYSENSCVCSPIFAVRINIGYRVPVDIDIKIGIHSAKINRIIRQRLEQKRKQKRICIGILQSTELIWTTAADPTSSRGVVSRRYIVRLHIAGDVCRSSTRAKRVSERG